MAARVLALIVDDSAVVRQVLTTLLEAAAGIEVLAACRDPLVAVPVMRRRWPDVIVLDVSMPRMDGLTFLRKIMQERPTPVVVCSSLTTEGAQGSVAALAAGAVAVVAKPSLGVKNFLLDAGAELVAAVRAAARTRVRALSELGAIRAAPATPSHTADVILAPPPARRHKRPRTPGTEPVVVIGASTGGTQALELVLTRLTPRAPGLVIVQHMPEVFTAAFAARLNGLCEIEVREAVSGEPVVAGCALIAPGGRHLLLHRVGTQYHVEVLYGPPVNRHRPSVDVLFRSAAHSAGANALGIIMTGMGHDGAAGLLEMRHAGACTLAQDADSCVVYGMPREAVRRGAAERSVALARIADEVLRLGA